jgi:DnaK suppressor protein
MTETITPELRRQLQVQLLASRTALEAQRQAHLAGQSRAVHAREVLLQDGDDATQRDAERTIDFDRTDRDAVELAAIDQALQRLDSGRYGLCADCGEPIAVQRLQAAPQVLRCLDCETAHERAAGPGRARPATL